MIWNQLFRMVNPGRQPPRLSPPGNGEYVDLTIEISVTPTTEPRPKTSSRRRILRVNTRLTAWVKARRREAFNAVAISPLSAAEPPSSLSVLEALATYTGMALQNVRSNTMPDLERQQAAAYLDRLDSNVFSMRETLFPSGDGSPSEFENSVATDGHVEAPALETCAHLPTQATACPVLTPDSSDLATHTPSVIAPEGLNQILSSTYSHESSFMLDNNSDALDVAHDGSDWNIPLGSIEAAATQAGLSRPTPGIADAFIYSRSTAFDASANNAVATADVNFAWEMQENLIDSAYWSTAGSRGQTNDYEFS